MHIVIGLLSMLLFASCMHHKSSYVNNDILPPDNYSQERIATKSTIQKTLTKEKNLQDNMMLAYLKMANSNYQPTIADLEIITLIPKRLKDRSSLSSAVLTLTIAAMIEIGSNNQTFEEEDLFKDEDISGTQTTINNQEISITETISKYNLDIAEQLLENPLLQASYIQKRILSLSPFLLPDIERKIINNLYINFTNWQALISQIKPTKDNLKKTSNPEQMNEVVAPKKVSPELPFGFNSETGSDSLLQEARRLSNRSQFKEAILLLSSISKEHSLYDASQEELRYISNLAVKELRKKAAIAFQNAMPVTDLKARTEYLIEAKQYLLSAIENFPTAEQLSTVQQNLNIINKNLELIQSQIDAN